MKNKLIYILILTLASSAAYAAGNKEAASSMTGKWKNTAMGAVFGINGKGVAGIKASSCEGRFEQTFSMSKGAIWLSEAEQMSKSLSIPKSQYNELVKEIDQNKSYPMLRSNCFENFNFYILSGTDTLISQSCSEADCVVARHVRTH